MRGRTGRPERGADAWPSCAAPPATTAAGVPGPAEPGAASQHVRVHDAQARTSWTGSSAPTLHGDVADLDLLRQPGGGVKGEADGQLGAGRRDRLAARCRPTCAAGGGTHVEATLAPLQSAALAQANPALASLGALDAALQAQGHARPLARAANRAPAELHASAGGGRLRSAGGVVAFESLALDAAGDLVGSRLAARASVELQRAPGRAALAGRRLVHHGRRQRAGGARRRAARRRASTSRWTTSASPTCRALWPAAWGGNVRPWLAQNVTAGTARDGAFNFTLSRAGG